MENPFALSRTRTIMTSGLTRDEMIDEFAGTPAPTYVETTRTFEEVTERTPIGKMVDAVAHLAGRVTLERSGK